MSELTATNQIARLEYVIREQMKEIDRLRDEVRQHRAPLYPRKKRSDDLPFAYLRALYL